MNIRQLVKYGQDELNKNDVEDVSIKTEILAEFVLNVSRQKIVVDGENEVSKEKEEEYKKYIDEIINGKPIQYITNSREFFGNVFYVDENVLIPQPDTEVLVEEAIKVIEEKIRNSESRIKILDLCCGSGCIGISIANKLREDKIQGFEIDFADISNEALEITKKNLFNIFYRDNLLKKFETDILRDENVSDNENDISRNYIFNFILTDMFENIDKNYDVIISNPPYIKRSDIDMLSKEVRNEPKIALDGGLDGLDFYRIIIENGREYIYEGGFLILEIGDTQKDEITEILSNNNMYKDFYFKEDYAGLDRVVVIEG